VRGTAASGGAGTLTVNSIVNNATFGGGSTILTDFQLNDEGAFFAFGSDSATMTNNKASFIQNVFVQSGQGRNLTVNGDTALVLQDANNLRIPTLTAGTDTGLTLTGSTSGENGINNVVLEGDAQTFFSTGSTGDYSFNISGTGNLAFNSNFATSLSGTNTYTGGTIFSDNPTLTGTTLSLQGAINGNNVAPTLDFDQAFNGTYAGVMSSNLLVEKNGIGTVTFSGINTYTGATTINAGTLSVTGAINGSSTTGVTSNGTLTGTGSVGPVNNSGTVTAGLAAGDTLTVNGAFDQSTNTAIFKSLVSDAAASQLSVTGTATLKGTLELDVSPGAYPAGTSYSVLTAGTRTNTFDTLVDNDPTGGWAASYSATDATVSNANQSVIIPSNLRLSRNSQDMQNYYFGNPSVTFATQDLTDVANTILSISNAQAYSEALLRLTPITTAANVAASYQNDLQMAIVLDRQFASNVKNSRQKSKQQNQQNECLSYGIPHTGAFLQPIILTYNQRQTTGSLATTTQIPFTALTYGIGAGYEHVLNNKFVFEGGVGYTHSNLSWKNNFGNSRWSALYFAPFFGWFNTHSFANIMVMGAIDFYTTHRRIQFTSINRVAKSRYNSYDLLVRMNGGTRIHCENNLWFQPDLTLNYLTVFRDQYQESGAGDLNLNVKQHTSFILQPSLRFRFIYETYLTPNFYCAPNVYVGYLANVPFDKAQIESRFTQAPSSLFFNVVGTRNVTHQLILGLEFFGRRTDKLEITCNFEADIFSDLEVLSLNTKIQWLF